MTAGYDASPKIPKIPHDFTARRLQSLAGFLFLLFLFEHLFTNSQATLFLGDDGKGFIDAVNFIHALPYLPVIEMALVGLPILAHVWWGISRLRMAKLNSAKSDGKTPSLAYSRNIAFTWQRITSVLLIVGILWHVAYMRFMKQPEEIHSGVYQEYLVKLTQDPGLYTVAPRLNVTLFSPQDLEKLQQVNLKHPFLEKKTLQEMKKQHLEPNQVLALSDNVGASFLMVVRDTYKSIWVSCLYSLFVVIAAFHGCNGLWTFAITWGISLSEKSRQLVRLMSNVLMAILIFFGLVCIWGVYWINLRY